jgi:mono/diheme cytochrome c family protein
MRLGIYTYPEAAYKLEWNTVLMNKKSSRKRNSIKINRSWVIILIIGIVLIGSGILLRIGNSNSNQVVIDSEAIVQGQVLYEENCASEQIISLIRNGGFQMPPVGAAMSDEQIESVIAYFKIWWTPQQRQMQRGEIGE